MTSFATLSLGTRKDAESWEKGCVGLGFDQSQSVREPNPSLDSVASVFRSGAEWIYFAGHFSQMELFNESATVKLKFTPAEVAISAGGKERTLKRGSDFTLHSSSRVILWGGCSVCSTNPSVETMRRLFGPHVLLGFDGVTGWKVVDAMLGGGFLKNDFFDRVKRNNGWAGTGSGVVSAWMETAAAGYANSKNERRFRAFDWEGQEFRLRDGAIVKGRTIR